jgi:F-type H+-transporting ATPase subunit a
MASLHISVAAEPLIKIGGFIISNSMLVSIIVTLCLIVFAFWYSRQSQKKGKKPFFFILMQTIFAGLLSFFEGVAGKKAKQFYPLLATFFIYIILANWSGLLPGVGSIGINEYLHGKKVFIPLFRGPTADINTTLALAIISVLTVQYFGIKNLGFLNYIKKYINLSGPIDFFVGILEIVSEFAKIMSFAFRLFGNIFAGEVLLTVMAAILPFLAPLPFLGLELFVGFIQALVFTMLSLVFMSVAVSSHDH